VVQGHNIGQAVNGSILNHIAHNPPLVGGHERAHKHRDRAEDSNSSQYKPGVDMFGEPPSKYNEEALGYVADGRDLLGQRVILAVVARYVRLELTTAVPCP